jgi:hypothetical protein
MTVDELLAREAIRDTIAAYTTMGDRGDIAAYAATFAEDGVLETPIGSATGPAGILTFVREVAIPNMAGYLKLGTRVRHHITTSRITLLSADDAEAWTYFQLVGDGRILEHGVYADRLRRIDDRWLFAHRKIRMEWEYQKQPA